ncbi:MAG: glycoside hydrolase family 15 protein [Pirellulales bacterium]
MAPAPTNRAFGAPGIAPRWTRGNKDAIGTAYSTSSRIWFSLAAGIVTETYYPTIDSPQIRDLQYLVSDGRTFFHDERRHLECEVELLSPYALGYRLTNTCRDKPYRIVKEVITDPHHPCLLVRTWLEGDDELLPQLRLFALLAPHLEVCGAGNTGYLDTVGAYDVLMAHKGSTWAALGATSPFLRRSCGYVGFSDGWTDLHDNFEMDWQFDLADNGNVALMAEIDLTRSREFTLALAFGSSEHAAQTTLVQTLNTPFADMRQRYIDEWQRTCAHVHDNDAFTGDAGCLWRRSHSVLLAHEDKQFPGATIASLSIPWGDSKGDDDLGGYHLVWPRDMVHTTTALLASGNTDTPYRALIYLACTQCEHGGFYQNFWIDGQPYWTGVQLDQVSFAVLLAWRLHRAGALREFDPYQMVRRAATFLVLHGPATAQERWEENSGYSPSTLAANIAALHCAAMMAAERGDLAVSQYLHDYADFVESHVERWTVTTQGTLVNGIPRHFIRILPVDLANPEANEDPNQALLLLKNQPPGQPYVFPAKEIVDAGFLELVRYGIRKPGDPLVEDSLAVIDRLLKVDTPLGPCWRRYNHDGYGQRDDGGPFDGWGQGRPWPLLTGERGHYELAAGRDPMPYIRAMEAFAAGGLLPEQIWDGPDIQRERLTMGSSTGAAMPLAWAHAEYISLVRSAADGQVFDLLPTLAERYQSGKGRRDLEIWKQNRHARSIAPGMTLRVQAPAPFVLHWTNSEWQQVHDAHAGGTPLGIYYVDIPVLRGQQAPIRFTFFWPAENRWEGRDYQTTIELPG